MNATTNNLKSVPAPISARLASLRRSLTQWVATKGLARWLLLFLAIIVIDIVIDRTFKMDFAQRAIMLVVMISLAVGLFYWRVMLPLSRRISDDALLHEIENKYPQLNEQLISCLLYTSPSPRDQRGSRMPSSA